MFIEERLLDCVSYGTVGGPFFSVRRVALRSGRVRRNANNSRPLYRYTILYRALHDADPDVRARSYRAIRDAFNATRAGTHGFRLKDWLDYSAEDELLPVLGTGTPQEIQLVKNYVFGSIGVERPIIKPVDGTVTMTADGAPVACTVDETTGIATVIAGSGDVLRWSGQFDVPVMFTQDYLPFDAVGRGADGLLVTADISLEEDLTADEEPVES